MADVIEKKRIFFIDFLRGLGIFIVIWIHTTSYFKYMSNSVFQMWNYLHFVVPLIIVVSGASLVLAYGKKINDLASSLYWIGKRTMRLLVPYYFFLIIWFILQSLMGTDGYSWPDIFIRINRSLIILDNLGGAALIRLIFGVSLFFPIFVIFHKKQKMWWLLLITSSIFIILRMTNVYIIEIPYSLLAWLVPFSAGMLLADIMGRYDKYKAVLKKNLWWLAVITSISFVILGIVKVGTLSDIALISHKYPPDILYFLYGTAGVLWVVLLALLTEKAMKGCKWWNKAVSYFSKNSFEVFLYHYLSMQLISSLFKNIGWMSTPGMWLPYFLTVLLLSIIFAAIAKKLLTWTKKGFAQIFQPLRHWLIKGH